MMPQVDAVEDVDGQDDVAPWGRGEFFNNPTCILEAENEEGRQHQPPETNPNLSLLFLLVFILVLLFVCA